jgi:hypothetical protein
MNRPIHHTQILPCTVTPASKTGKIIIIIITTLVILGFQWFNFDRRSALGRLYRVKVDCRSFAGTCCLHLQVQNEQSERMFMIYKFVI